MTDPATVHAAVFRAPGQPLEIIDAPVPALGAAEVLVRVRCCTICGSDLRTISGARTGPMPSVLGHEILGDVVDVASDVRFHGSDRPVAVGDRVTWAVTVSCHRCRNCRRGLPQKCDHVFKYGHEPLASAGPFSGGLAEVCVLRPGTAIFSVPSGVDDLVAAPASCATATAVAALRVGNVSDSATVLVQGAGLLGLSACALAAARGGRVLVVDPDENRRVWARRFGAETVCEADQPDLEEIVADFTHGAGFDLAVEASGSAAALGRGLSCLGIGGRYVLAGTVSPTPAWSVDPEQVVRRLLRIEGIHNYTPDDLAGALDFLAGIGTRFPFRDVVVAGHGLRDIGVAIEHASRADALRVAVLPRAVDDGGK